MKNLITGATAAAALALSLSALPAAAQESQTIHVGQLPTATDPAYFFLTSGTAASPSITANFGDTISGKSETFDDTYDFTIDQNGVGSGSVSTSGSKTTLLTINDVIINGTSYSAAAAAAGINFVPITDGKLNQIEVQGITGPKTIAGTYTGTATFQAVSAAPEPATWMLMFGGVAMIGMALRRRPVGVATA